VIADAEVNNVYNPNGTVALPPQASNLRHRRALVSTCSERGRLGISSGLTKRKAPVVGVVSLQSQRPRWSRFTLTTSSRRIPSTHAGFWRLPKSEHPKSPESNPTSTATLAPSRLDPVPEVPHPTSRLQRCNNILSFLAILLLYHCHYSIHIPSCCRQRARSVAASVFSSSLSSLFDHAHAECPRR
jgi:hypothetical protein